MLSGLNEFDLCGLFLKLNNSLGQSKKNSNSFRHESILKLPGGMALLVGLSAIHIETWKACYVESSSKTKVENRIASVYKTIKFSDTQKTQNMKSHI